MIENYKRESNFRHEEALVWWFLILAILTIYFKFSYLTTIYPEGFDVLVSSYMQGNSTLEYVKLASFIFIKSFVEISLFILFFYFVFYRLLHVNIKIVIISSILIILIVGSVNQLSLQSVRSIITLDSLMITFDWIKDNPDVISSYITKKNLVYFILSIILLIIPLVISSKYFQVQPIIWLNKLLLIIVPLLIIVSLFFYVFMGTFIKKDANIKPLDGYWSSIALSLIQGNKSNLVNRNVLPLKELKSNYENLIYAKKPPEYKSSVNVGKRHIIIIGLETAPEKYYPIINNPKFKNFYKMCQSSIISKQHFTTTPYTFYASYSILTGTYVPPAGNALVFGNMVFNSLGNILSNYNYVPTYIDSYYVDWHAGTSHNKVFKKFGFKDVFDRNDYDYKNKIKVLDSEYEKGLYAETKSFEHAIKSIDDAIAQNKKSVIFLSTSLGHFNWKATKNHNDLSNKEKILELASTLDGLLENFLTALKERNIEDNVIIAITGDHGLRYHDEFSSLSEIDRNITVAFNVPLIMYVPNALERQIVLDHPTSHVDITPTLLELIGIDTSEYFFHGDNILNPALKNRLIFMMNQGLKPENSFYKENMFHTYNELSGNIFVSKYESNISTNSPTMNTYDKEQHIKNIIHNAKEQFNDLGAYNLKQKK